MSRPFKRFLLLPLFVCLLASVGAQTTGNAGTPAAVSEPAAAGTTAADAQAQQGTSETSDTSDNGAAAGEQQTDTNIDSQSPAAPNTAENPAEESDGAGAVSASDGTPSDEIAPDI